MPVNMPVNTVVKQAGRCSRDAAQGAAMHQFVSQVAVLCRLYGKCRGLADKVVVYMCVHECPRIRSTPLLL